MFQWQYDAINKTNRVPTSSIVLICKWLNHTSMRDEKESKNNLPSIPIQDTVDDGPSLERIVSCVTSTLS